MTRVNVVIPTYSGGRLLVRCLRTLAHSTYRDFDVVVYDDGSREPVEDTITGIVPRLSVIRAESNGGLCRAFNRAIARGSAEYVVLLNDDVEVEPRWLEELVACADRHPQAGSVASKMRLMSDRCKLHSAGDFFSVRGVPGNRGAWLDDLGQFDHEEQVFSACAGAALYRRAALEMVALPGGHTFDDRLFMYCEDVELAWRLQRAGYACWFAPAAVVYHHLSATGGGTLSSYYVNRNTLLVLARSVPRRIVAKYWPRMLAAHLGRLARTIQHAREPAARAALRGMVAAIPLLIADHRPCPALAEPDLARLEHVLAHR